MNILILPSWYPSKEQPLNGIFFKEQAEAIKENLEIDDNIYVLAYRYYSLLELFDFIKSTKKKISFDNGIKTYVFTFLKIFPKLDFLLFRYSGFLLSIWINRIENENRIKIDIVHIHSALNAGIFYYFSKCKIPYVITEHSSTYLKKSLTKLQKRYLPFVFNNAKEVLAVGKGLRNEVSCFTKKPIQIIFNMVTPPSIIKNEPIENYDDFIFFSLGLNANTKGFDLLIRAFTIVNKEIPNTKLTIAGLSKLERNNLEQLVSEKLINSKIFLLPTLTRDKVFTKMGTCNCFILLSRVETFGIVFVEAMYCGKPVIGTTTGGPDSFITKETGLLVPCEDIEKAATAMKEMIKNYKNYNSSIIKEYALTNFSREVIAKKIIKIYNETIDMGSSIILLK